MTTYRVTRPDKSNRTDLGLGSIPRAICWAMGHNFAVGNWIQGLCIDGVITMVNLPCLTCERCLLSILDEDRIEWAKTGFREQEKMRRTMRSMLEGIREYEEPPEGLEWMDELEEEG